MSIYSQTAVIYSPLTLLGVVTTVYGLWGNEYIRLWLPWFNAYHLFGIMVILLLVIMFLFHRFILPSYYAFQMQQSYKHRNPVTQDLVEIKERLVEIERLLNNVQSKPQTSESLSKTED